MHYHCELIQHDGWIEVDARSTYDAASRELADCLRDELEEGQAVDVRPNLSDSGYNAVRLPDGELLGRLRECYASACLRTWSVTERLRWHVRALNEDDACELVAARGDGAVADDDRVTFDACPSRRAVEVAP